MLPSEWNSVTPAAGGLRAMVCDKCSGHEQTRDMWKVGHGQCTAIAKNGGAKQRILQLADVPRPHIATQQ